MLASECVFINVSTTNRCFVSAPGFPRLASQRPAMPLPRPPPFLPPALSAAANADSTPTQLPAIPLPRPPRFPPPTPSAAASVKSTPTQVFAIPMPWPPHFPPPTPSAASPTSTPIQPPQANTTLPTRPSHPPPQHQPHAVKLCHTLSPAVYLPSKKALAPQSMPIKAKPLHLEKPQAPMTTTPAAVAQAAPDSQLLNRHHHPYSPLQSISSCIPDLGDDCVACLDQLISFPRHSLLSLQHSMTSCHQRSLKCNVKLLSLTNCQIPCPIQCLRSC